MDITNDFARVIQSADGVPCLVQRWYGYDDDDDAVDGYYFQTVFYKNDARVEATVFAAEMSEEDCEEHWLSLIADLQTAKEGTDK